MKLPLVLLPVALLAAALVAACGSSTNKTLETANQMAASATPSAASASPSPTVASSTVKEFGPPPVLGGNVQKIWPAYASTVPQATTKKANPDTNSGICAAITFDAPATNIQWFRMAVDGTEVTQQMTVAVHTVGTDNQVTGGEFCWAPKDGNGLSIGVHSAAVAVENPSSNALNQPPVQNIGWKFKVTP